ncbi:hypothetical protein PHMEG_00021879 [Phytophthora megakarya]|uniref:Uncharacterized protein n=1 Tax=Phytophthora megakarya TaxID=4795 RepID=A0A225VKJ9_9STRA|nr:hypothetical protein PHMEG_00021879 [Phytophthora megakarya]
MVTIGNEEDSCVAHNKKIAQPRRKRKATGTRRKEEIQELVDEVKTLQTQIAALQKNEAVQTSTKHSELQQYILETGFIRQAVLQQQASLVNVQSALSRLTVTSLDSLIIINA